MNAIRLLLIIRIFGAGITAGLFGHQYENIADSYGFDLLSICYLFAVLTFYTFLYLIRFFSPCSFDDERDKKFILRTQILLSLVSAVLTVLAICKHAKAFNFEAYVHISLAILFIFLPDLVYDFLIKIYNLLTKDNGSDSLKNS